MIIGQYIPDFISSIRNETFTNVNCTFQLLNLDRKAMEFMSYPFILSLWGVEG